MIVRRVRRQVRHADAPARWSSMLTAAISQLHVRTTWTFSDTRSRQHVPHPNSRSVHRVHSAHAPDHGLHRTAPAATRAAIIGEARDVHECVPHKSREQCSHVSCLHNKRCLAQSHFSETFTSHKQHTVSRFFAARLRRNGSSAACAQARLRIGVRTAARVTVSRLTRVPRERTLAPDGATRRGRSARDCSAAIGRGRDGRHCVGKFSPLRTAVSRPACPAAD